ncbi:MAG: methylenetetrahydrofolate reductase C-terminal domain-containing protein [Caldimicrobium sp.]
MATEFKKLLQEKDFIFTFELVPGRSVRTRHYQDILKFLEESSQNKIFQVFSITDNAGGHPALSPIPLGKTIKDLGLEAIIHFSCKDKNRNQIESELLALDREGLRNLLVLTGDYPFYGYLGKAKPVFDLDSVLLLQMISEMERGIELPKGAPGGGIRLPGIPFFKGAVVNPFKLTSAELFWQYIKLYKKIKSGANFIITQVGFFPYKWKELKIIQEKGFFKVFSNLLDYPLEDTEGDNLFKTIPLFGSILYLTPFLANLVKKGKIPGILITEKISKELEKTSDFEKKNIELLAQIASVLKFLGYKGVHLCGFPLNYGKIFQFLETFQKFDGRGGEFIDKFDGIVVLDTPNGTIRREFTSFLTDNLDFSLKGRRSLTYFINELIHRVFFNPSNFLYKFIKKLLLRIDSSSFCKKHFTNLEYFIKKLLFNCQECGDCTLWEFNYYCPQSGCAKYLLNGPCGGSIAGYCEVYPFFKKCHYVSALERATSKEALKKFFYPNKNFYLPPRNWELYKSSSWLNFYLERDHHKDERRNS